MEDKKTVLLIDLSALYHAAHHAVAENESITKVQDITMANVRKCVGMVDSETLVAICCDSRKSWRKEIYPEYKAHREAKPASFYGLFDGTIKKLKDEGYLCWSADGFEADDIIATAHDAARALGHDVVIASHDKDLCQLAGAHTRILRTHDWTTVGEEEITAKFGVTPPQIADYLALAGDSSDNVPGCKGIGAKTAAELLQTYGNLRRIFDAVINTSADGIRLKNDAGTYEHNGATATEPFWKSHKAVRANLVACHDDVMVSSKLVALDPGAPIRFEEIYEERKIAPRTAPVNFADAGDFDDETASVINRVFTPGNIQPKEAKKVEDNENSAAVPNGETAQHQSTTKEAAPAEETARHLGNAPVNAAAKVDPSGSATEVPHVNAEPVIESRALVVAEFTKQLEPTTPGGAMKMAQVLHNSRLYSKYSSEDQIFAAMARGRAMGYCGAEALDLFWPMDAGQGKVLAPKAHLIVHLCESHPDCEYFILTESTLTQATYVARRKSWPKDREVKFTYTIEEAVQTGLTTLELLPRPQPRADAKPGEKVKDDRNPWQKNRREMLRKTCATQLARIVFPGAGLGLATYEELGGRDD